MDQLMKLFFEKERWINAIDIAFGKNINSDILRAICTPENRIQLYHAIRDGKYTISPPHEAQIPKEDGTFRTVYVNENEDRVILSIFNDMLFELCPELIHENCKSYQKGIGCGKVVQNVSKVMRNMPDGEIGVKVDLSKYFDSVPIEYIDNTFDYVEHKFGQSALLDTIRKYYHTDTVIDMHKQLIEKYSSLRQGCAVAAFLANAVLADIDAEISKYDVCYYRYSDDILIIGNDWKKGYAVLQKMLTEKQLILNPKKVEILYKNKWFRFLGFMLRDDKITLSSSRLKSFQKEIEHRTIDKIGSQTLSHTINAVNEYLYKGDGQYSWATSVLPIINVNKDVQTLNSFVMDAIRASHTNKKSIGGLGSVRDRSDETILRGKGRNVKSNKEKVPFLPDYKTIKCMQNVINTSKAAYDTLVMAM